jgi:3-hydroxypropanoate dehydrogenase
MTSLLTDSRSPLDPLALPAEAHALLFTEARTANTFSDEPVSDAQLEAR